MVLQSDGQISVSDIADEYLLKKGTSKVNVYSAEYGVSQPTSLGDFRGRANKGTEWALNFTGLTGGSTVKDVKIDGSSNIYVCGTTSNSTYFNDNSNNTFTTSLLSPTPDAFIAKYLANGTVAWVVKLGTPAGTDTANGLALDPSGNVYVTGQYGLNPLVTTGSGPMDFGGSITLASAVGGDVFVSKYDGSNGTPIWAARAFSSGVDVANAIAYDPTGTGNVYVTGSYTGGIFTTLDKDGTAFGNALPTTTNADVFTAKYTSAGGAGWVALANSGGSDTANDLAVNATSGDVFVTGSYNGNFIVYGANSSSLPSISANSSVDGYILKYTSAGVATWVAKMSATGTTSENSYSIALDAGGNIYVTGNFTTDLNLYSASAITTIAKTVTSSATQTGFLAKFTSAGAASWVLRFDSTGSDVGFGVCVHPFDDSPIVCGTYTAAASFYTVSNNTTAAKTTASATGTDSFLAKYTSDGNTCSWVARLAGTGTDTWNRVAVDRNSPYSIVAAGSCTTASTLYNFAETGNRALTFPGVTTLGVTARYSSDGTAVQQAMTVWTAAQSNSVTGIALDSSDNILITGSFRGVLGFIQPDGTAFYPPGIVSADQANMFVAKFSKSGYCLWAQCVSGTGPSSGAAIAIDTSDDACYITGQYTTATFGPTTSMGSSGIDMFVAKYDKDGTFAWVARTGSGTGTEQGIAISVGPDGVYATGATNTAGTVNFFSAGSVTSNYDVSSVAANNSFTVKYSSSLGVVQWAAKSSGATGTSRTTGIVATSDNGVLIAGYYVTSLTVSDAALLSTPLTKTAPTNTAAANGFIAKYNSVGRALWVSAMYSNLTTTTTTQVNAMTLDSTGNIFVTGTYSHAMSFFDSAGGNEVKLPLLTGSDMFAAKYSAAGVPQWSVRGGSSSSGATGKAIVADVSGDIYIGGQSSQGTNPVGYNPVFFGTSGPLLDTGFGNAGNQDAFVVRYTSTGVVKSASRIYSSGADNIVGMATSSAGRGRVYFAGTLGTSTNGVIQKPTGYGNITKSPAMSSGNSFVSYLTFPTTSQDAWVAPVQAPNASSAVVNGIAFDTNGNMYLTGNFTGVLHGVRSFNQAFFLAKYAPDGTLSWIAHGASIAGVVTSVGVAVSGSTSVYITGLWASSASVNTLQIYTDGVANPNVTQTGYNSSTGFTLKFDAANGNSLWCARCTPACITYGIAVDSSGYVYVTGVWGSGTSGNLVFYNSLNVAYATSLAIGSTVGSYYAFLVKYDSAGLVQWATRVVSPTNTAGTTVQSYGIAVGSNSVYITGGYTGTLDAYHASGTKYATASLTQIGGSDIFVIKYDWAGAVQWVAKGGSLAGTDNGRSIAVDTLNPENVYLTGECTGAMTFYEKDTNTNPSATITQVGGQDLFVAKYTAAGAFSWGKQFGSAGTDNAWSIAWSASNVYVTGRFAGTTLSGTTITGVSNAMYVLGLADGTGNVAVSNSAVSATGSIVVRKPSGNVFVGGNYTAATMTLATNGTTAPGFVTEYDPGTLVFQKATAIGSTATTPTSTVNGLAYDGNNYIYAVGTFTNHVSVFSADTNTSNMHTETGTNTGYFVSKYTYGGDLLWSQSGIGATTNGNAICVSPDGTSVFIAGDFKSGTLHGTTVGSSAQMFIAKYAQNGTLGWFITGSAATSSVANSIKADATSVYATGAYTGLWTLATGVSITQVSGQDAWVAQFNASTGVAQWVAKLGSNGSDSANGLALDTDSNVYITGHYNGTSTGLAVSNQGGSTAFTLPLFVTSQQTFVVKYTSAGVAQWGARSNTSAATGCAGNAIAIDTVTGNVYIAGSYGNAAMTVYAKNDATNVPLNAFGGSTDVFLAKYSPTGDLSWATRMGGTSSNDNAYGLAADNAGNVYVTGEFANTVMSFFNAGNPTASSVSAPITGGLDGFMAKYTNAGQVAWAMRWGSNNSINERGRAVVIDSKGTCCVIGGQVASGPAQFYDSANVLYKQMAITNANQVQIGFVSRVPLP